MKNKLHTAIFAAVVLASSPINSIAAEPSCIEDHGKFMTHYYEMLSTDAAIAESVAQISDPQLKQKHVIDRIYAIEQFIVENHKEMMTSCGTIKPDDYAAAWNAYRSGVMGLKLGRDGLQQKRGFDIGSRLVIERGLADQENPSPDRYTGKVPFLLSYRDDKVSGESGISLLGDISYRFGIDLSGWHALAASLDVDTTKPVAESTVDIGYGSTWINVHGKKGERFIDETVTELNAAWKTDRDFKRKAYIAQLKVVPTIGSLKAGGYVIHNGPLDWLWSPSLAISAGNVIEANGNEDFLAMQLQGSFVQATPALAVSIGARNLPKLQFVAEYAHTFDLKNGRNEGMLQAGLSYQLAGPASLTMVYREGYEAPFFKKTHQYLVGIGIEY